MIEGAIFDLDGTLLDTMAMWMNVIFDYLAQNNRTPKPGLMDELSTMSLAQCAEYCQKEYSMSQTVQEIVDGILSHVAHFYLHEAKPMPHVEDLLEGLKERGVKMCVATASDHALIEKALERLGLRHYFSQILDCIEAGHGKDEPIIYRLSLEHLGTDKAKTVVFEDATHAMDTARKDGFLVASIYSSFEKDVEVVKSLSNIHIQSYDNLTDFWNFADNL